MNTLTSTHFGVADEVTLARVIYDMPPELEQEAEAHVATLATISAEPLVELFPGRGIVPDDKKGRAETFRRLGEGADFVIRHAAQPADRLGAAVVAAEIQNTATAVAGYDAIQGVQYDVFDIPPVHEGSAERGQFIAALVDRYGLEPDGDGAATTAYIMDHAREWDLHAAERYENERPS
jgi:hypothetical protein